MFPNPSNKEVRCLRQWGFESTSIKQQFSDSYDQLKKKTQRLSQIARKRKEQEGGEEGKEEEKEEEK